MTGQEIREWKEDFVTWQEESMKAHQANLMKIEEESARKLAEIRAEAERRQAEAERKHAEVEHRQAEFRAEAEREQVEFRAEAEREQVEFRAEAERKHAEAQAKIDRLRMENDAQLKELGRQIGGLGEKFGGFTEGMAFPSMEKVLRERFKMEFVSLRVKKRKNGQTMELDVLAYSNSRNNDLYVVEVKSRLREEGYKRLLQLLREFPQFFPEHRDKRLFGILACVDSPEHLERRVLQAGIYLAKIHDETFRIQVPAGFTPKSYQN